MHLHFLVEYFHPFLFPFLPQSQINYFAIFSSHYFGLHPSCKVDLQNLFIYLFSEKLCPAYKEKLETVSNVLESQMLNSCVPSLTAALLPTAVILYSVFRVDKIPACILLWYINL